MTPHDQSDDNDSYDAALVQPVSRPAGDVEQETEEIRSGIEQTRNEMSQTIDAIQEKLNPQHIVDQAKDSVREATTEFVENAKETVREATIGRVEDMVTNVTDTAKGASSGIMETIKQNPIPAALAGIGLGWLFMKSRSGPTGGQAYSYQGGRDNTPYRSYGDRGSYRADYDYRRSYNYSQQQGGLGETVSHAGDKLGNVAGSVGDKAGDIAGQVGQTAGDVVGNIQEKAGDAAGSVQERAGDIAEQVGYRAQRAQGQFERILYENPLAVGAAAAILGAAIGLIVPETEQEHKVMGEARDSLMGKAQEVAGDAMDKVKQVTEQAGNAIQDEVERQGIMS